MAKSIVLEGPEGVGKTTQASLLGYLLEEYAKLPILRVREPGGTPVGEAIRSVLFTSEFRNMDATTNVLLFSASRNEVLVNKVKPWLEENPTGISIGDRDWWPTIALQASDGADPGYIEATQKPFMWYPNRTYYLDLPAEESIVRVRMAKIKEGVRNWRDDVPIETYREIRENYLSLVKKWQDKVCLVDAFKDPWNVTFDIVRDLLLEMKTEEPTRELATDLLKNFNYSTLRKIADKANDEGRVPYSRLSRDAELEREVRIKEGFSEQGQLREKMYKDWENLGLVRPRINTEHER